MAKTQVRHVLRSGCASCWLQYTVACHNQPCLDPNEPHSICFPCAAQCERRAGDPNPAPKICCAEDIPCRYNENTDPATGKVIGYSCITQAVSVVDQGMPPLMRHGSANWKVIVARQGCFSSGCQARRRLTWSCRRPPGCSVRHPNKRTPTAQRCRARSRIHSAAANSAKAAGSLSALSSAENLTPRVTRGISAGASASMVSAGVLHQQCHASPCMQVDPL